MLDSRLHNMSRLIFVVSLIGASWLTRQTEGDWVYGGWCHKDAGDFPRRLLLLRHSVVVFIVRVVRVDVIVVRIFHFAEP